MTHLTPTLTFRTSSQEFKYLAMCQYRAITYSCGHTLHSRVRNSQRCGNITCSYTGVPITQTTTYHWCPPCNRGEGAIQGHGQTNLRRRRNAHIEPSDIAAAIARENARVRRARNISVPEPTSIVVPPPSVRFRGCIYHAIASHTHQTPARAFTPTEAAKRVAYGIPGIIKAGEQMVDHTTRSSFLLDGWRRGMIVFLFYALLFCFLLLCTFSYFLYFLGHLQ